MGDKINTEEFIKRAKIVHGDKFDYSNVNYINTTTKICIICSKHGEFWQTPSNHLQGKGCPKCANKNVTTEDFIVKANIKHNYKYDYSLVNYINSKTPIKIICPVHGGFSQTPLDHLATKGCYKCTLELLSKSNNEFINEAIIKHGLRYDYSKTNYINTQTKVCVICHKEDENGVEHGEFWQLPKTHLECNCPKCDYQKNITTKMVINRFKELHGERYDYSLVNYKSMHRKVDIICLEENHGIFNQTPASHLHKDKHGCPICGGNSIPTNEDIINRFIKKHGDKYDYSLVKYVDNSTPVKIICNVDGHGVFEQAVYNHANGAECPRCAGRNKTKDECIEIFKNAHKQDFDKYDYSLFEYLGVDEKAKIICKLENHGVFEQSFYQHSKGAGCPKCAGRHKTTEDFINKAKTKNGYRYDYSMTEYIDSQTKVKMRCIKHDLIFEISPLAHYYGVGCPICSQSIGETKLYTALFENNISFVKQKRFTDCRNKKPLSFGCYIESMNICVEYNGKQHYNSIGYFGGETQLKYQQNNDSIKKKYCEEKNIHLFNIRFDENVEEKLIEFGIINKKESA